MPSLFNVIKNTSVNSTGSKEINTEYSVRVHKSKNRDVAQDQKQKELGEKNAKDFIKSYEVLARTMLEKARNESEEIVSGAYAKAKSIEEDAYTKGFEIGKEDGYSDGYSKGKLEADEYYANIKDKANEEIAVLNKNAKDMLINAKDELTNYIKANEHNIQELIVHIVKKVMLKEIENSDAITNMIMDALETAKDSKNIIIKTKSTYIDDIKEKIELWKAQAVFNGKVFVIIDDNLEDGKAVIEKENGKIVVDVMGTLDKIQEIVNEN
ncbi:fliH protein [Clostridium massiliodielmoense]|uniref:FliH/SctL family protein n=1 Tax=Clostridium massiliodielmoense TaxID=1776385 RepID=UPI0004DB07DE|nr:fliH protein [Clostridium massiliodielmoense]KEH96953.1 fliH protein [Clostridium botulinum C/D str. BKT12695]